jgi:hypothetical protein
MINSYKNTAFNNFYRILNSSNNPLFIRLSAAFVVKLFYYVLINSSTRFRSTKSALDKLPKPVSTTLGRTAQKRYYDDFMRGFGVRITSGGTKAFFVEKLIKNKLS